MLLPHEARLRDTTRSMLALALSTRDYIDRALVPVFLKRVAKDPSLGDVLNLFLRVSAWMRTLSSLENDWDFQAVAAGARAIFETAVDLVLLEADKSGEALEKMKAFELRQVYRSARASQKYLDEARAAGVPESQLEGYELGGDAERRKYLSDNREQVEKDKARFWPDRLDESGKRHRVEPSRWTGRNLGDDAKEAPARFGFRHFYELWHRWHCWQVHGSSLTGMRTMTRAQAFSSIAMTLNFSCQFAAVAAAATSKMLCVEKDERVTHWLGNELRKYYPAEPPPTQSVGEPG